MGGCGSGNWYRWNKKSTENDFLRLPAQSLKKYAHINRGQKETGSWQWSRNGEVCSWTSYEINTCHEPMWMRVYYTNKSTNQQYDYKITLVTTKPHYGGERWWFICPAQGCGKRVGVLCLGKIFACRHCHNMTYSTQNQQAYDRLCDKAFKIARQLGHEGNVIDGFYGKKPKGMHRKTYNRKIALLEHATRHSMIGMAARFGIKEGRHQIQT